MLKRKHFAVVVLMALALAIAGLAQAAPVQGYPALQGVKSMNAVIDVRGKSPAAVLGALKLVHAMFKDKAVTQTDPERHFVVIFIGPAVKLVSTARQGFSPAEGKVLDKLAQEVKAMAADGIKLELCVFAAKVFKVDLATILPEITQVPNGWISLIGYQQKGFALVPIY